VIRLSAKLTPQARTPDAHLAGTGARLCNLGQAQPSWTNEFMADDGLHVSESSIVEEKKPFSAAKDKKGLMPVPPPGVGRGGAKRLLARSNADYSPMILRTTSVIEITPTGFSFSVTTRRCIRRPVIRLTASLNSMSASQVAQPGVMTSLASIARA
jgi:hypothetical protein